MTKKDENSSNKLTLHNWNAFSYKFMTSAIKEKYWQFFEPSAEGAVAPTLVQQAAANDFLASHMSDDVTWILEQTGSRDPSILWDALKSELGDTRKDPEIEIDKAKNIICHGTDTHDFFFRVATAVNDLRRLGITKDEFGDKQIISILVKGLSDKHFRLLKVQLLLDLACWNDNPIKLTQQNVKKKIELFKQTCIASHESALDSKELKESASVAKSNKEKRFCQHCHNLGGHHRKHAKTHNEKFCRCKEKQEKANKATDLDFDDEDEKANITKYSANKSNALAYSPFYFDSAATKHMCFQRNLFKDFEDIKPRKVVLGDDSYVPAIGVGTISFLSNIDGREVSTNLHKVLYVPDLKNNLISLAVLLRENYKQVWGGLKVDIYFRNNRSMLLRGILEPNNLIVCNGVPVEQSEKSLFLLSSAADLQLWHKRFAHCGQSTLIKTAKLVSGMEFRNMDFNMCEACELGKSKAHPHYTSSSKSTAVGDLIVSDIGPMKAATLFGESYYVIFVDDYSHYCCLYLLKTKGAEEVFNAFKAFEARLKNVHDVRIRKIKIFRSDDDGAYYGNFTRYFRDNGIKHEFSLPYDHQQNGISERMNRTILDKARTMLIDAKLPEELWGYAAEYACYITNRTYTSVRKSKTPFELFHRQKPTVGHIRRFGCVAYAHVPEETRQKLDNRGRKCRFLGVSIRHKGYVLIEISTHRMIYSRDVVFDEKWESNSESLTSSKIAFEDIETADGDYIPGDTSGNNDKSEISNEATNRESDTESDSTEDSLIETESSITTGQSQTSGTRLDSKESQASSGIENCQVRSESPTETTTRPQRSRKGPREWWKVDNATYDFDAYHAFITATSEDEPKTLNEARSRPDWPKWLEAMKEEIKSHQENKTWILQNRVKGRKVVKCKWVYKIKYNHDGTVNKYKARLVAKGFTQVYGIDYEETFAPVVQLKSIRTFLALAASEKQKVHQYDFKTAFLNSNLNETIYMEQPDGFSGPGKEDLVCLLKKGLYGLKQANREWYGMLSKYLLTLGFKQSASDACIFTYSNSNGKMVLSVYVDDILTFASNESLRNEIMTKVMKKFKVTELGIAKWFLGLHISQHHDGSITIDQEKYITDLLHEYGMSNCKPVSTPLDSAYIKLLDCAKNDPSYISPIKASYNEVVGKLMYAMVATRPDIAVSMSVVSKYLTRPEKIHWEFVLRILRYLKGTLSLGIKYSPSTFKNDTKIVAWTDADYASCLETGKSNTGFGVKLCNGLVSWYSKKQTTVALSTAEAEYISACSCAKEIAWFRQLLSDMGYNQSAPTVIHEDNQSCIQMAKNPQVNNKTKHIQVRFHYVREQVHDNQILFHYCPTKDQMADIFTKGLTKATFVTLRQMLGLTELTGSVKVDNS